jgi:hypothetical protein
MKNYEVTLHATVRKSIGVQAPDREAAMDLAADSIDTTDFDLGEWEVLNLEIHHVEEHYEED